MGWPVEGRHAGSVHRGAADGDALDPNGRGAAPGPAETGPVEQRNFARRRRAGP